MHGVFIRTFTTNLILFNYLSIAVGNSHKDLVQPNETHLEGVPMFIQHPKPLYYTLKDHPATVECTAEPVSHAVIECAEQAIPYKGPEDSGRLKVIRLDSKNRPDPNGNRWRLQLQVRAKEVEEWFDSYVCRCEAWNRVIQLQRPKKVISKSAVVVEAYLERRFRLEPASTELLAGQRLDLTCVSPEGRPEPEVYWIKNGLRVGFPQMSYRSTSNGRTHLTIQNVTLNDSGNYTCVAELLGVEYRFATAHVSVREPMESRLTTPDTSPTKTRNYDSLTQFSVSRDALIYATMFSILSAILVVLLILMFTRKHKQRTSYWLFDNCFKKSGLKQTELLIKNPAIYSVLQPENTVTANDKLRSIANGQSGRSQVSPADCSPSVTPYETLDCTLPLSRWNSHYSNHTRNVTTEESTKQAFPPAMLSFSNGTFFNLTTLSNSPKSQFFFSGLSQPVYAVANQITGFQHTPSYTVSPALCGKTAQNVNAPEANFHDVSTVSMSPNSWSKDAHISQCASTVPHLKCNTGGPCSLDSTTNTTHVSSIREDCSSASNSDNLTTGVVASPVPPAFPLPSSCSNKPYTNPERVTCCSSAKAVFNQPGGQTNLRCADVSLAILPDSVNPRDLDRIYVNVCSGDQCRPVVEEHQTLLTPVLEIGPGNLLIDRPVLLSFQHCADLDHGNWRIYLMGTQRPHDKQAQRLMHAINEQRNFGPDEVNHIAYDVYDTHLGNTIDQHFDGLSWKKLGIIGTDCWDSTVKCHLSGQMAQLSTTVAQCYCLVGESNNYESARNHRRRTMDLDLGDERKEREHADPSKLSNNFAVFRECTSLLSASQNRAVKLLNLVAFAGPVTTSMEFAVRVYVLPATSHFLDQAINTEKEVGFQVMDIAKQWAFVDSGVGLVLHIREVTYDWSSRPQTEIQQIPFPHIWSGLHTSMLHCSFSLEHENPGITSVACSIDVRQGDDLSNTTTLRIYSDTIKNFIN